MVKLSMENEGLEGPTQIAVTVPLFLKKLWKMVNDKDAENIIGWNSAGDGFIIYDQLQFITKLLPQYFKHNNMASFIRQLNFYDFHKIAGIDKDEIQFAHNYFVRDLPETLVFIKRKCTSVKSKLTNNVKEEEISDLLSGVKELKSKHSLVDNELKMLKQENAALWSEINNLRIKHSKQTKVINKIIHFLISYMHSQNALSKRNGVTARKGNQKKLGPTILEIDYHNQHPDTSKPNIQNEYIVQEPCGDVDYDIANDSESNMQLSMNNSLGDIFLGPTTSQDANLPYPSPYPKKCIITSKNSASPSATLRNNAFKKQKIKSVVLNPNMIDNLQATTLSNVSPRSQISQGSINVKTEDDCFRAELDPQNYTDNSKAFTLGLSRVDDPRSTVSKVMSSSRAGLLQNSVATAKNPKNDLASTKVFEKSADHLDSYFSDNESAPSANNPSRINILENPKENLGLYLNNIQTELTSLQDVLGNLSSTELNDFCELMETMEPEMDQDNLDMGTSEEGMEQVDELEAEQIEVPIDNSEELVSKDILIDGLDTLPVECGLNDNLNNKNNNFEGDQFTQDTMIPEVLVDEYFNPDF